MGFASLFVSVTLQPRPNLVKVQGQEIIFLFSAPITKSPDPQSLKLSNMVSCPFTALTPGCGGVKSCCLDHSAKLVS